MERTSNLMATPGWSQEQGFSQDRLDHDVLPLDKLASEDDINQEPQDATPRRNPHRGGGGQQQQRQQPERPDLEDVLTQLAQEILTMRRDVATNQPQQPRHDDLPEDPNFNWGLLKFPAETKFVMPSTGVIYVC